MFISRRLKKIYQFYLFIYVFDFICTIWRRYLPIRIQQVFNDLYYFQKVDIFETRNCEQIHFEKGKNFCDDFAFTKWKTFK